MALLLTSRLLFLPWFFFSANGGGLIFGRLRLGRVVTPCFRGEGGYRPPARGGGAATTEVRSLSLFCSMVWDLITWRLRAGVPRDPRMRWLSLAAELRVGRDCRIVVHILSGGEKGRRGREEDSDFRKS